MANSDALKFVGRRKKLSLADAALAALILSVVGLMVVPLPTWLLDLLLAANLAMSVTVLLVAVYVSDALKIAAFPTLLLLTTLVRLALNVSSTRLILLQANAGQVIRAFGDFVVRGNYVVGAVVFLILSIIQFVVIAKGSERVAEVGARFTLDAMPGKQMAIDAELRSGGIDGEEAKVRRRTLARESQFYGAMDGAMKFVKGDVIASFLITIINILGGLAIGAGQKGMALTDALKRYGLLTIGDGLVSQIPSLVIATAAGVLVTRVASDEPDTPLGKELSDQLLGQPRAILVASGFVMALALVPGLPIVPFLVIGVLMFIGARARTEHVRKTAQQAEHTQPATQGPTPERRFVPLVVPWQLDISPDLASLLEDELRGNDVKRAGIRAAAAAAREVMFRQLGVPLPNGRISVSEVLPARCIVVSIHELPTETFSLPDSVNPQQLAEVVLSRVLSVLLPRAQDFLGLTETQNLLDQLEQHAPASVRQVVPKPVSLTVINDVLKRLVEEGISIRDLKAILEALAQVAATEKDPLNLAEFVRSQLRRPITHMLTQGHPELSVCVLDVEIEETIRSSISRTGAGSFLTLAPAAGRDIVGAVKQALSNAGETNLESPVLLTQPDIRRFVRKLVETDLPDLKVVSYADLLPELNLRPTAKATLSSIQ
jgi:type III secretion protein V